MMTSYLVHGFHRQKDGMYGWMIVDIDDQGRVSAHETAERIAPEFCFVTAGNFTGVAPDNCKSRIFLTAEELCELAPDLRSNFPSLRKRRSRK